MAQAEADVCENGDAASCSKTPLFLMLMIFMTLACVFFFGGGGIISGPPWGLSHYHVCPTMAI